VRVGLSLLSFKGNAARSTSNQGPSEPRLSPSDNFAIDVPLILKVSFAVLVCFGFFVREMA
jgi:hypothetical protein